MRKLKHESDTQHADFYSELKSKLDFYIDADYEIKGKVGDKDIEVLVDEKVIFRLERISGVTPKYGLRIMPQYCKRFISKPYEDFVMALLKVPYVVDLYWR